MSLYGHWRDHRDDGCVIRFARLGVILGVVVTAVMKLPVKPLQTERSKTMGFFDKAKQKADWHKAELDPRNKERKEKRVAYDEKYNKCSHGTHNKGDCGKRRLIF